MDPTTQRLLRAANEREAIEQAERAQADLIASGVMLALANLPAFENVELGGRIVAATIEDETAAFQIRGVGSTRSYTIRIPGDYLRQVVEQLDLAKAELDASSEGEKPEDPPDA